MVIFNITSADFQGYQLENDHKGPSINDVASLEGGRGGQIDDMGRYEGGRCQKNPISSIQNWQIMIFFKILPVLERLFLF